MRNESIVCYVSYVKEPNTSVRSRLTYTIDVTVVKAFEAALNLLKDP
jgi:hypothetical protein